MLLEIHNFLTKEGTPYAIIGGFAVQYWGEPRFTRDIDVTVLVPVNKTEEFVQLVTANFQSRINDPIDFAKKTRMVLIKTSDGSEIDISLGIPGYEDEVIKRAVDYKVDETHLRLCSAEDLIIHKVVASRPRDLQDVEGIISRQGKRLDKNYIMGWLKQFSEALEKPIDKQLENLWNKLAD